MMRPTRLDRRLAKALDPVVERLDSIDTTIGTTAAKVVEQAATKVADAEQRVTAATAQAGERVLFAERQAADAVAAVRAELADARSETIANGIADLTARLKWASDARDRFEAKNAEQAGLIAELERRLEVVTIERDEARRQHDAQQAVVVDWVDAHGVLADRLAAVTAAVVPVLPDAHRGVEARPRGGSKTKARRRLTELTALVTDST